MLTTSTLALVWMLLVTMLVKVDGQEGLFPFFRVGLFAALPFALFHAARLAVSAVRATAGQWVMLAGLVWLLVYPFMTMAFGTFSERNVKDAAYTVAIYIVMLWIVRAGFRRREGGLDVDGLGWFLVAFALVEAALALSLRAGLVIDLGFGVTFLQQPWLDGRLHGVVGTPSHLAPILGVASLFLITRRPTALRSLILGVLVLCLVMTGSRSALLALAAACGVYVVIQAIDLRISRRRLVQCGALLAGVVLVMIVFWERTAAVLEIALRVDPPDWEKNRFVMWSARLAELSERGVAEQLFGTGYRSVSQTFNINVEFLTNYGALYAVAFTVVYAEIVIRLFARAAGARDAATTFLVMLAVFVYVFSQGLNFLLHQFVTAIHLAMAIVVLGYLDRTSAAAVREPASRPLPSVPRRSMVGELPAGVRAR